MNYIDADAKLQGRCKQSRKVQRNTYLQRRDDGAIALRLHCTDILTFHPDGSIDLYNGGFPTCTTHERMNGFLPKGYRVHGEPVETRRTTGAGMTVLSRRADGEEYRYNIAEEVTCGNSAHILADGSLEGGNVKEYRKERAEEQAAARRPINRARYWVSKARGIFVDRTGCTAAKRWECNSRGWHARQGVTLEPAQAEKNLDCGCLVYRKVAKPSKALTVQSIMAEENATARAAKMSIYGTDRFFLDASPKVIAEDSERGYTLLSLELGRWQDVRALKMACPSTGVVYVQTVPPHTGTIPDALDWIFDTENYLGQVSQQA